MEIFWVRRASSSVSASAQTRDLRRERIEMVYLKSIPKFGDVAIKYGYVKRKDVAQALSKQLGGNLSLLGDILVEMKLLTETQRSKVLDVLTMLPRIPVGTDTKFGVSLREFVTDKQAVGLYLALNNRLIPDHANLFLADGSHTYYLFLALVTVRRCVSVVTNNLGIAGEYILRPGQITELRFPSMGVVHRHYGALFDLDEDMLRSQIRDACVFVSAPALDPMRGPCSDNLSAKVKREALQTAPWLTILCDYDNLCQDPTAHAPILPGDLIKVWRECRSRQNTRIITTPHPQMPTSELKRPPDMRTPYADAPVGSWELYSQNCRLLYGEMGSRFIEIQSNGTPVVYEKSER
jgi:hypothetical protein